MESNEELIPIMTPRKRGRPRKIDLIIREREKKPEKKSKAKEYKYKEAKDVKEEKPSKMVSIESSIEEKLMEMYRIGFDDGLKVGRIIELERKNKNK